MTSAVSEAAKQGDRSENGDYIYGKRRLAEIDRRVRYLNKRLDELQIVSEPPSDPSKIYFAANVVLEKEDGDTLALQIVGPDEFNLREGKLSMDSPLAKALLGKQTDDEVSISVDGKTTYYGVISISYN